MGEELVGISAGITIPFTPGLVAGQLTLSGSLVIDRNFNVDFVVTPEVGVGAGSTGIFPGSAFLRGVVSFDPDVTVKSLKGFAPSVTADALLLSGSTTRTGDGLIFEAGITTPSISVSGTAGFGLSTADAIRGVSDLISPDPTLDSGVNSFTGGGASGGFVLYPSKPNLNQVQSVYAK